MATPSAASCLTAQPSALRRAPASSSSAFVRGSRGGGGLIQPLRRLATALPRSVGRGARAAASNDGAPTHWSPPSNIRTSPYTPPPGRDMPGPRDMYEGTTGLDVLAMQNDLVAEGYLTPSDATGCVSSPLHIPTHAPRGRRQYTRCDTGPVSSPLARCSFFNAPPRAPSNPVGKARPNYNRWGSVPPAKL
jgi:hypothetical protein